MLDCNFDGNLIKIKINFLTKGGNGMAGIDCMDFLGYYLVIIVGLIVYFFVNTRISENLLPADAPFSDWIISLCFGMPLLLLASLRTVIEEIFSKKE